MQTELYKKYVDLELKFKALEEQKALLRGEILADLKRSKTDKVTTEYGTFTVAKKTKWIYTEAVQKIQDRLKIAQVREQEKGLASKEISEYLMFKENDKDSI